MKKPLAPFNAGKGCCSGGRAFARPSSQRGGARPGALIPGVVRNPLPGAVPAAGLVFGLAGQTGGGRDPFWKLEKVKMLPEAGSIAAL